MTTAAPPTDFGTGLRRALEQRGALGAAGLPFSTLTLLVRDLAEAAEPAPAYERSLDLRLAT